MSTESRLKRYRIISLVAIALLIGSVFYILIVLGQNSRLSERLNKERLAGETLLSEKLSLERDLMKLESDHQSLNSRNIELVRHNDQLKQKVEQAERSEANSLGKLSRLMSIRNQNVLLQKQLDSASIQLAMEKRAHQETHDFNDQIQQQLSFSREEAARLSQEREDLLRASVNNILVETVSRNNYLTVRSRRIRQMKILFEVPDHTGYLSYSIHSPTGIAIASGAANIAPLEAGTVGTNRQDVQASLSSREDRIVWKKMALNFTPSGRLSPGVYQINIARDSTSIGSLQVKLR